MANTFVKLAGDAVRNAVAMPPGSDPEAVAKHAIIEAAKIHAPHLVSSLTDGAHGMGRPGCHHHGEKRRHSGHWYRHGERIVLVGV